MTDEKAPKPPQTRWTRAGTGAAMARPSGPGSIPLPDADRIQGATVIGAGTRKDTRTRLRYSDANGKWYSLEMPFLDAMYLLNVLRAIQVDEGFEMPPDP